MFFSEEGSTQLKCINNWFIKNMNEDELQQTCITFGLSRQDITKKQQIVNPIRLNLC
jgi:hypothetical protein